MKAKNPDRRTFIAKSVAGALAMESIVSACGESPVDVPTPPPPAGLSVNLRPVGETHPGEIRFDGSPVEVTYTLEVAEGTADTIEWSVEIVGDVDTGEPVKANETDGGQQLVSILRSGGLIDPYGVR